ncbi:DinB family protein [Hymenobacter jeollabukensis]|uniref:DinB family protein n=1 Tax=Hymenobacter jeollabukensis TaxID=2025313 RepID=A0A5R8WQM5_9BACT|nr:DinB family protein [Hymenobacter jeollabukensis]TLM92240.1 DinB family protein [Hymenobacter jeollabukensis]
MAASAPLRTTEFLDQLTQAVADVRRVTQERFRPLSEDQLNRGPAPGKWSVGQCLEHLNIIGGLYLPVMNQRLRRAQERGTQPAEFVKNGYFGKKLTVAMQTPAREKPLRTPQQYAPSGSRLPRTVVEVFLRQLDDLSHQLQVARTVNANAVRIPNAIVPLLRLRLTDQFAFLIAHLQRHIAQAERVLDSRSVSR